MRWRRPDGLGQLDPTAGIELARLGGLEALARSVLVGVIPLTAFEALGSKKAVSYVFFGGAAMTLFFTLNVGWLEVRLHRRWVVTLASGLLFLSAVLFTFAQGPVFALAEGLRSSEASLFSVCLSLYIMDFIGKHELTMTESRRMAYSGLAWVAGPSIGVWLWSRGHTSAPFVISMVANVLMLAYFWRLRIHHNPVLRGPTTAVTRPLHNIAHFFKQRSLRIAYAITTARSVFWAALFIYGPIYVIEAGLPAWAAGSFLSVASAMLFLGPIVSRIAYRIGVRRLIVGAMVVVAANMTALAFVGSPKPYGIAFWIGGAIGGAALDVVGNIPFMRLVKPRQRTSMTTVFSTWREVSALITPAIAAVALALGSFPLLYLTIAMLLLGAALSASYLPQRL